MFPSSSVGDKEDNFSLSKKEVDASAAATPQIKLHSLSTTLTQESNPFRLISEVAQTLHGKCLLANRRSVSFSVRTVTRKFIILTFPLRVFKD
jgi:hypothetical protein